MSPKVNPKKEAKAIHILISNDFVSISTSLMPHSGGQDKKSVLTLSLNDIIFGYLSTSNAAILE